MPAILLYANLTTGGISRTLSGEGLTLPPLTQGDDLEIGFRFCEQIDGENVEVTRTVRALRAGIGKIDARPASGQIELEIDSVSIGVLTYPFTAAELLAAYPDAVAVREVNESFIIESETELEITVASNSLDPISFLRQDQWESDGHWFHELRFQQAPVAFSETWDTPVPLAPSIVEVQDGATYEDFVVNEVQHLVVPPAFRGTFVLSRGAAMKETVPLGREERPSEIAAALNEIAPEGGEFLVTLAYNSVARIEFSGTMEGTDHDPLIVRVVAAPEGDPTITLRLDTAELSALFRDSNELLLPLEVEAEIEDPRDDEVVRRFTLVRQNVTIREQLVRDEDAVAQAIDWQRPPRPSNYIPWTEDQVITGSQHYSAAVAASPAVIDHNLGTSDLHVTVYDDDGENLLDSTWTFTRDSDDSGTLVYPGGDVTILITAAGPTSVFQSHTHTTAQVVGLDSLIATIGSRLEALEALAPVVGLRRSASVTYAETWEIPGFFEVFPVLGKTTIDEADLESDGLKALNRADLPKFVPALYPAIHQTTSPTAVTVSGGAPSGSGTAGILYQNQSGSTISVSLSSPVETEDDPYGYSFQLPDDGFLAWNGSEWYPLAQYGLDSSYYARTLERTLFHDVISSDQLTAGRQFDLEFTVEARAIAANTPWHWHLVIETAQLAGATTPATTAGPTSCTADHTTETFTASAHGMSDGQIVQLGGTAVPTGLTAATDYYVVSAATNTFQLATVIGGTAAAFTSNGTSVTFTKYTRPGGNLATDTWHAPHLDQKILLGGSTRSYTFGYRVVRDKGGDLSAEQLVYGKWLAATAPDAAGFAIRARLVRADTLNRIASPRGFLAVRMASGEGGGYLKIS